MKDTITNEGGKLRSVTGKGVLALRFKAIILALEFRERHGFEMDRRFNTLKIAKQTTGLKTNKIPALVAKLQEMHDQTINECEVRQDGAVVQTPSFTIETESNGDMYALSMKPTDLEPGAELAHIGRRLRVLGRVDAKPGERFYRGRFRVVDVGAVGEVTTSPRPESMNGALIIERTPAPDPKQPGVIFIRIPDTLQRPIDGGCSCSYCTAHPDRTPMWDTLAVATEKPKDHKPDYAWTVHHPDPGPRCRVVGCYARVRYRGAICDPCAGAGKT